MTDDPSQKKDQVVRLLLDGLPSAPMQRATVLGDRLVVPFAAGGHTRKTLTIQIKSADHRWGRPAPSRVQSTNATALT